MMYLACMNIRNAFDSWLERAKTLYESREAESIADWAFEHITGMRRLDRLTWPEKQLEPAVLQRLEQAMNQLEQGMPIQYVLEEAWFMGDAFRVRPGVLIPRPETEELLQWMLDDVTLVAQQRSSLRLLDLGTGSGCLPIAFQKRLPEAESFGLDISPQALAIAAENSRRLGVPVHWIEADMLRPDTFPSLPSMNLLVSNPPYIPQGEAEHMQVQVRDFEPHLALFVPDEDPLLFYKALLGLAPRLGTPDHCLYLEVHEDYAEAVRLLCLGSSYREVDLRTDLQGKNRMIRLCGWNSDAA